MILLVAGRSHPILGSGHDSKHLTVSKDTAESLEKPVAPDFGVATSGNTQYTRGQGGRRTGTVRQLSAAVAGGLEYGVQ